MDRAEYEALLSVQTAYLTQVGPDTQFTAGALCRMHRDWLGSIYEWAGKYRTVELEKGGFRWPPAFRVGENMARFESGLLARNTPCRPGGLAGVARRIAEVHAELLLIHPFRDGNGRVARWLADLMALQAGFPAPAYGFAGRRAGARRKQYMEAVRAGYLQDYDALTRFFAEAVNRRLREPGPDV
jgi:cell filamentation protein